MEKIYNVAPTKIDIEGFGSVMIRSNHVDRRAIEEMLGGLEINQGFNSQSSAEIEIGRLSKSLPIAASQVPEVIRCACGKPGNYWGVGLAFPDPLCNSCVKKQLNPSIRVNYTRFLLYLTMAALAALILFYGFGMD